MKKILFQYSFLNALSMFVILFLSTATPSFAQTSSIKKQETIVIDDDKMNNENTTIEIKNGQLFVDGKKIINDIADRDKNVKIIKKKSFQNEKELMEENGGDDFPDNRNFPNSFSNNKAVLGVSTSTTEKNDGAMVERVMPNSAAQQAGIQKGDLITKVNKKMILNPKDLVEEIAQYKVGDKINFTFERNNQTLTKVATLQANGAYNSFNENTPPFSLFPFGDEENIFGKNFRFQYHNMDEKPRIGLQIEDTPNADGVLVTDVLDNSVAAKAGIENGDIIHSFHKTDIKNVDDLMDAIEQAKSLDKVNMDIERNGVKRQISMNMPKSIRKRKI